MAFGGITSRRSRALLQQLVDGHPQVRALLFNKNSATTDFNVVGCGVLPGSFNPLHDGHRQMAAAASRKLNGASVLYELSVTNADKGTLPIADLIARIQQFGVTLGNSSTSRSDNQDDCGLILTREPLFAGKAAVLGGVSFVVGYDTAARILNPIYYGGDDGLADVLKDLQEKSVRFVVAGRISNPGVGDGHFLTLEDLSIPNGFENMFVRFSEQEFRIDLSSSMLRAKAKASTNDGRKKEALLELNGTSGSKL